MRALLFMSVLIAACASSSPPPPKDQTVTVFVMSGREQPPAEDVTVQVAAPVLVHAEGLGPPRVNVFAPDGRRIDTTDVGSDQRFTPTAPGKYRVELTETPGLVLVNVVAR